MIHVLALLLMLAADTAAPAGPATVRPAATAPACSPAADPNGLVEVLHEMTGRLEGLDREAVADAAAVILARHVERTAMCRRLDSRGREIQLLEEDLADARLEISLYRESRELLRTQWEAALKMPAAATGRRLLACGPGGSLAYVDGELVPAASLACILALWP